MATPSELKKTVIHLRADDTLVKKLDEGKTVYGSRSEFIRRAIDAFGASPRVGAEGHYGRPQGAAK